MAWQALTESELIFTTEDGWTTTTLPWYSVLPCGRPSASASEAMNSQEERASSAATGLPRYGHDFRYSHTACQTQCSTSSGAYTGAHRRGSTVQALARLYITSRACT